MLVAEPVLAKVASAELGGEPGGVKVGSSVNRTHKTHTLAIAKDGK